MNFSELIKNGVVAPEIDHAKIMKDVAKMQASDHLCDVGTTDVEFVQNCVLRCDVNVPPSKVEPLMRRWRKHRRGTPVFHKQKNKYGLQIRLWLREDTDVDKLNDLLPNLSNKPTVSASGAITISDNAFAWELIDKGLITPTNRNKEE
jgi:hypothetical protein